MFEGVLLKFLDDEPIRLRRCGLPFDFGRVAGAFVFEQLERGSTGLGVDELDLAMSRTLPRWDGYRS